MVSLEQLIERIAAAELLTAEVVRGVIASIPEAERPASSDELAVVLVERDLLTTFQSRELLKLQGQRLQLGQYQLLDRIGDGGMGTVFKALHRAMQRQVALKVLHADIAESPDGLRRFRREMRAGGKLNHPNVVATLDADQDGDTLFLVMEYISGTNLSALVATQGPLSVGRALKYIVQAARGLAHAHDRQIIHRDIKPSNLLCDERDNIRVLDLGLARFDTGGESQHAQLTGTGEMLGTVDYMAPEQAQSTRQADARSDIYSLGCTLAYLLTGQPPYGGESVLKRLMAHRDKPLPSLDELRQDIPAEVNRIFQKMIAKQPADRYQSMRELLTDLEPLAGLNSPRSRWRPWAVIAASALLVLIAGVLIANRTPRDEPFVASPERIVAPPLADAPFEETQAAAHQAAWAKYLDQPIETTNSIGMKLRLIPPGEFSQGAGTQEVADFSQLEGRSLETDGPQHRVRLTRPFYLGTTEVTQAQFQAGIGSNPSMFSPTGDYGVRVAEFDAAQLPVENVTWFDAIDFCNALSQREQLTPCYKRNDNDVTILDGTGYRLPTEAEWEFACRAGTETPWSFGGDETPFEPFAWVSTNSGFHSRPVEQLAANAFRLHDLHGNLWEWCQDSFDPHFYKSLADAITVDPIGPPPSGVRCIRGGVWDNTIRLCRSAHRGANQATTHNASIGFRVLRPVEAVRPAPK